MRWVNVTCDKSQRIVPVQKYLFSLLDIEPDYISTGSEPVSKWCKIVHDNLPDQPYLVFGLDDYLPIGFDRKAFNIAFSIMTQNRLDRMELIKRGKWKTEGEKFDTPNEYQVSCQFSIWKVESLKRILKEVNGSPWDFEVEGRCKSGIVKEDVLTYAHESSLSDRWTGINWRLIPDNLKKECQSIIEGN